LGGVQKKKTCGTSSGVTRKRDKTVPKLKSRANERRGKRKRFVSSCGTRKEMLFVPSF